MDTKEAGRKGGQSKSNAKIVASKGNLKKAWAVRAAGPTEWADPVYREMMRWRCSPWKSRKES